MLFSKETYLRSLLTVLLSTTALIPAAEAQNSGRVGAVNLDATGTPPGAGTRTLTIGTNIIYKERVQTSASGSTQIMFPDTSTLNVGRNSSIVIDEYVYDPNAGTGKMVASVSKGVMRFVGGQISHTAGVTINTPVATLGIRGGVPDLQHVLDAGGATHPGTGAAADQSAAVLRREDHLRTPRPGVPQSAHRDGWPVRLRTARGATGRRQPGLGRPVVVHAELERPR